MDEMLINQDKMKYKDPRLETEFLGLNFKNPVLLASGTCGFGREFAEFFDLEQLGGICTKCVTKYPIPGNEGIRVWETPSGLLNSIGLENPGIQAFIQNELGWLNSLDLVKVVNLGGHSFEDYSEGAAMLNSVNLDMIELNISCPNVKEGGMNFGIKTETARKIIKAVRAVCRHKLIIKLSPNAEDIVSLAKVCEEEGADGVSVINTVLAMAIDIENRKAVFNNIYAGLSGPAIKPIALRMVHQVSKSVNIPVMAVGGISNWSDAIEFIMAGAALIQVGTANFANPTVSLGIIAGISDWLEREGVDSIQEIRGII